MPSMRMNTTAKADTAGSSSEWTTVKSKADIQKAAEVAQKKSAQVCTPPIVSLSREQLVDQHLKQHSCLALHTASCQLHCMRLDPQWGAGAQCTSNFGAHLQF